MDAKALIGIRAVERHSNVVRARKLEENRGKLVLRAEVLKLSGRDHAVYTRRIRDATI